MCEIRPFVNIEEFMKVTGFKPGDVITLKALCSSKKYVGVFVGYEESIPSKKIEFNVYEFYKDKKSVGKSEIFIGPWRWSLNSLRGWYYLSKGKWKNAGIEIKPAKFKVGCVYLDKNNKKYTVIAKYRSPLNKILYIVASEEGVIGEMTYEVHKDFDTGNEVARFKNVKDKYVIFSADNECVYLP